MAEMPLCPSVALLRSLGRTSSPRRCLHRLANRQHRALHVSRVLGQEERPQKSFHGQLYESTAERVQRERAEQKRFAEMRNESGKGRNAAVTAGWPSMNIHLTREQPLTTNSFTRHFSNRLLDWHPNISTPTA